MERIIFNGEHLTFEQVLQVAYGTPVVELSEVARVNVQRAADAVQRLLADGVVAYGITTGFGAFKNKVIRPEDVAQLQYNIIVSHAVGVGDVFDIPTTACDYAHPRQYVSTRLQWYSLGNA
jgi:histidine ammonia-lyase